MFNKKGPLADLKRDVYAVDLRNHGESPHMSDTSYAGMAKDLVRFLDEQDIQSCAVLGHSMGGKTAMQLALSAPSRVTKLVVCDIAPVQYRRDGPGSFSALFDAMQVVSCVILPRLPAAGHLRDL
jgi:esterase